jgi:ribosome recycling factor
MIKDVVKELEEKMNKTVNVLKEDFNSIRAGKANPQLLDRVMVDYYGSATPLKSMASVSAPEPRMLLIQPYDTTAIKDIEKGIMIADLGFNPSNDGKIIRIMVPALTEERRKELIKLAKKSGEDAKVALRNERRTANELIKKLNKNSEITEDDVKTAEADIQKLTDKFVKTVDTLIEQKDKEIMEV